MILSHMDPEYVRSKRFKWLAEQVGGFYVVGETERYGFSAGRASDADVEHTLNREDTWGNPTRRRQKGNQEKLLGRSISHDSTVNFRFMYAAVTEGQHGRDKVVQVMIDTYRDAWEEVIGSLKLQVRRGGGGTRRSAR